MTHGCWLYICRSGNAVVVIVVVCTYLALSVFFSARHKQASVGISTGVPEAAPAKMREERGFELQRGVNMLIICTAGNGWLVVVLLLKLRSGAKRKTKANTHDEG